MHYLAFTSIYEAYHHRILLFWISICLEIVAEIHQLGISSNSLGNAQSKGNTKIKRVNSSTQVWNWVTQSNDKLASLSSCQAAHQFDLQPKGLHQKRVLRVCYGNSTRRLIGCPLGVLFTQYRLSTQSSFGQ